MKPGINTSSNVVSFFKDLRPASARLLAQAGPQNKIATTTLPSNVIRINRFGTLHHRDDHLSTEKLLENMVNNASRIAIKQENGHNIMLQKSLRAPILTVFNNPHAPTQPRFSQNTNGIFAKNGARVATLVSNTQNDNTSSHTNSI